MTSREAYVFGWVFGRLTAAALPAAIGGDIGLAAARPYSALARVIADAHRLHLLTGDLDRQIGQALCEIDSVEPPMQGGSEQYQPLGQQGAWNLGYFAGREVHALMPAEFDVAAARREKGWTQAQLAEQMGVDQAVLSRWESGRVQPNPDNLARLKELLL